MEFFPGAFESEWERRRAALLQDLEAGKSKSTDSDWGWMKRGGGVSRLPRDEPGVVGPRSSSRRGSGDSSAASIGEDGAGRSMRTRFEAVARGSQSAVVKLTSYGGGARSASMMSYVSRGGELAVETETGERVLGKGALSDLRADWEHLFENRAESRDIGVFRVTVESMPGGSTGLEFDDAVRHILKSGFGDRHFVYAATRDASGSTEIEGVVVLRDAKGERLTGDAKAATIVQERFDLSEAAGIAGATFFFGGYGNGVDYGTARVRNLVERSGGGVRDESGRAIATAEVAGDLVQKEWRDDLHSRKGRDVMHLIVSARAGTDVAAFNSAVREFLGAQFEGHRYVFTMHDPADDPKEIGQGGRRPHIHAHAIITMRSETGERLVMSPRVFREWRVAMAEKAREHGIDMEMTDRREFASAPAFTRNQVRPINYRGQTEHVGTSEAAQARYDSKRVNARTSPTSRRSREYSAAAKQAWEEVAVTSGDRKVASFASRLAERIERMPSAEADQSSGQLAPAFLLKEIENAIGKEEDHMRQMTRPEFEAYEKRVETVLQDVERTLDTADLRDFGEVAAAARDVVNIRREYVGVREEIEPNERQEPQRRELSADEHEQRDLTTETEQGTIDTGPSGERDERIGKFAVAGAGRAEPESHSASDANKTSSSGAMSERAQEPSPEERNDLDSQSGQSLEQEPAEAGAAEGGDRRDGHPKTAAREKEAERADPPQQHVPRLRELEREIEDKNQQQDRDARER